jgi:hypothetical protein
MHFATKGPKHAILVTLLLVVTNFVGAQDAV